jgi:hypothetical protein
MLFVHGPSRFRGCSGFGGANLGDRFENEFADLSELQEHIASAKKAGGHGSGTSHEGGTVKGRGYRWSAAVWTGSRIASSADVPETSSVALLIVLPMVHWSSGRAAAPFLFH